MTWNKRPKYRNVRTVVDGITFDSKREAERYGELKLLERDGQITDLEVHPRFVLQEGFRLPYGKRVPAITYTADFGYNEWNARIVEDVKGVETAVFKLKQRLFWKRYPDIELRVVH